MSHKEIKTIIIEKIQPYSLDIKRSNYISRLARQYSYELLVDCIEIGVSSYLCYDNEENLTQESVNIFLDKLGGIAYNKSRSPREQEIEHLKNKGKSKFAYWNSARAYEILRNYVNELDSHGWSEEMIVGELRGRAMCLINSSKNWTEWSSTMKNWIEDCKQKDEDVTISIEQLGTILPEALFDNIHTTFQKLCKQINAGYENNLFDCTAVIMRRLLECLLILYYQKLDIESDIMDESKKQYITLDKIIENVQDNKIIELSHNTKKNILLFKDLGNYSSRKIWYNCSRQDIEPHILRYRYIIEELMSKSGMKG